MKSLCTLFPVLLFCLGCAAPIRQYYTDSFMQDDGVYENKTIGFSLLYVGDWMLITDPREMKGGAFDLAKQLHNTGAELLYVGATVDVSQGTRAIAVQLNEDPEIYTQRLRELNRSSIDEEFGVTPMLINDKPMIKWEYSTGGFRFVEFIFAVRMYNVRIAFWTQPARYENFLPVYEEIMATMSQRSSLR